MRRIMVPVVLSALAFTAACNSTSDGGATVSQDTPTPVTSPAPTVHLSAFAQLKADLDDKLGDSNLDGYDRRVVAVTYSNADPHFLSVRFEIQDNLSGGLIQSGARRDVVDILRIVHSEEARFPKVRTVGIFGMFPGQDKYGKESNTQALTYNFARATLDRIDYDNVDPDQLDSLAKFGGFRPGFF